jgi:hydrogenase maturation protease
VTAAPGALVVCVGNALVGDDAVGCAVHAALAARPLPSGVRLELLALGGLRLLDLLEGEARLVVVDAVQLGAPAGTVHLLRWAELPPPTTATTSHGVGLREAMEVGRRLSPERMPGEALLVGIEGRVFDEVGGAMTPAVAAAVERAAALALAAAAGAAPPAPGA